MTTSPGRVLVTRSGVLTELVHARNTDAAALPEPNRVVVDDMRAALDRYLTLGCEVHATADGWVLLGSGRMRFVLVDSVREHTGQGT